MSALQDKRVVITGAARGIGRGAAEACAAAGARLALLDVREDELEQTAHRLRDAGAEVSAHVCDVAVPEDVERAVAEVAAGGPIDVLINNAGVVPAVRPFEEITVEEWDALMAINTRGYFLMAKATVGHLRAAGGGAIVMIASRQFFYAPPGQADYVAAKGAVIGMARVMAKELGPDGIRVNCVCPGMLLTPGVEEAVPGAAERAEGMLAAVPLGRVQTVEDFTGAIVFLASDESRFMTGQTMVVDGGMYMH
jgi:NAD(P)-dependent dehydrogenase (short-subunit alcohol dehydrogenase family)